MSKTYRLGDLAEIGRGSSPRPINDQRYFVNGNIPWIKIADATSSGKYIYKTKEHVNEYGASFSRKLKPNTLIIAASGTLGFPKFLGCEGCIHDGWMYFSDIKTKIIEPDYLYYCLITLRGYYNNLSYGAAIQNINTPIVKKTRVELPTLCEQKRIANILSTYDDLIENNNRRIALLEKAAQELYKEWFVRFRFPGYENAEFENGIPKGWKIKRLSDYGRVETGKTPSTEIADNYGEEYMFVKTPDMHGNVFTIHTSEYLSQQGHFTQPKKLLPFNSIMVSCIGTGGVVSINAEQAHTNQQINSIILKNPLFLEWLFFTCKSLKETIELFGATGATMTNLSKGKFEKLKVISPTESLVLLFHDKVNYIFEEIKSLMYQNRNLTKQRDSLLPRLMSGKLEV